MNSSSLWRRRAKSAVLNPYIVVADFALSLMIIIVYFLVTARVTEAIYASEEKNFNFAARTVPHLTSYYRKVVRNGPVLNYWFPNAVLFTNGYISTNGTNAMRGMATVLKTSRCAPLVERVRLTVSYPAEWNVQNAQTNADALGTVLVTSGVTCPILFSGRSQREPWLKNKSELASTEFSVQLKSPKSSTQL